MISRTLVTGLLALGLLVTAPLLGTPQVQVDIYGHAGARLALPALDAGAIQTRVAEQFPRERVSQAFAPKWGPLAAHAAVDDTAAGDGAAVMRIVAIDTIAPDHVRLRVSAHDREVGHAIATEIVRSVHVADLRERVLIRSETTGGRLVLLLQAAALIALAWCCGALGWRALLAASRSRLPVGAASR